MNTAKRSPVIDIDKEFSLLMELVNSLWNGCNTASIKRALQLAFEQGLEDTHANEMAV